MVGQINKTRAKILVFSLIATFIVIRVWLYFYPNADFNVAGYNIHHLYTGLLLIVIGGIPLILFSGTGRILDLATVIFGIGLSLALDEWVYLIATDGSNMSYLLPVSLWGGIILIGLTSLYVGALYFWSCKINKGK